MKLKKNDKIKIVKELAEKAKQEQTFIITNYHGLTSQDCNDFRLKLFEKGMICKAAKKKLIDIILKNAKLEDIDIRSIEGQLALAWGEDGAELAKTVSQFGKQKNKDMIIAGFLDGKYLSKEIVIALSNLPNLATLRAQFVGALKSTMFGLVNVLNGNQRKLVLTLKAIGERKALL
jgi:large subunit ribosomal protein L10